MAGFQGPTPVAFRTGNRFLTRPFTVSCSLLVPSLSVRKEQSGATGKHFHAVCRQPLTFLSSFLSPTSPRFHVACSPAELTEISVDYLIHLGRREKSVSVTHQQNIVLSPQRLLRDHLTQERTPLS